MTQLPETLVPTTLITSTPEEGRLLAIALVRHSLKAMEKEFEVLKRGHPRYSQEPFGVTEASHVVAVEFATIAAANNYWRSSGAS
jgi:hypothetical protein